MKKLMSLKDDVIAIIVALGFSVLFLGSFKQALFLSIIFFIISLVFLFISPFLAYLVWRKLPILIFTQPLKASILIVLSFYLIIAVNGFLIRYLLHFFEVSLPLFTFFVFVYMITRAFLKLL